MEQFILALIVGIGTGGLYSMMATGLVVAYKGSGIINFGHTAIGMYGAFTFDEILKKGTIKLPWFDFLPDVIPFDIPVSIKVADPSKANWSWLAIILAILMSCFLGLAAHLLVFRPLRNGSALSKVIGSLGVLLYVQSVTELGFGSQNRSPAGFLPTGSIRNVLGLGGDLATSYLVIAVASLVLGLLVWLLYQKTPFGLMTRAADENEKGAVVLGFSPQLIAGANWVLAALTAVIGALLYIGISSLTIGSYTGFIVPALSAALIGNLSNIGVTVIGGLGLGMLQSGLQNLATTKSWWPHWAPPTGTRSVLPLLVVIAVLYFRGNKIPLRGAIAPPRQARVPMQKLPWVAPAVAAVLFGVLSVIFTSSWEVALSSTIVSATIMLSMVVIIGFLGQISLAQMSLAGVAAYALVRFASDGTAVGGVTVDGPGLPHPLAALLAVTVTVIVGLIIAAPALRIRGVQLAVVTMTAVIAIQEFIFRNESLVGPAAKTNGPVPRPNWFGWDVGVTYKVKPPPAKNNTFTDRWQFTIFALIFLVVLVWLLNNLRRSGTGRRFLAIRSNERAAASGGINIAQTKLLGFGIAAAVAGIGGVLFAYKIQSVKYENFGLFVGLGLLAFAVIGGITTPSGAVVGGVLAAGGLVPFFFSEIFDNPNFVKYVGAIGAIALVFNAIMNPEGIAGGLAFKKPKKHKAKPTVAAEEVPA